MFVIDNDILVTNSNIFVINSDTFVITNNIFVINSNIFSGWKKLVKYNIKVINMHEVI